LTRIDKLQSKIDRMASENKGVHSVNQQLMEANEGLAVDRQNLQTVLEQFDLAMVRLDRYADELERANQKRNDQGSTVHSLIWKLSSSRKIKERQATQFNLTLGQQNKQIEKLPATLSQTCSYEPSELRQMGDQSITTWKTIFSQRQRYNDEQLHFSHILSCYSCTGYEFLRSRMVNFPTPQTTHRYFGARLKEYENELTKLEELPAFLDRLVESHPLLSSGVCLAIDAISCSSTFLNAYEIKESEDSYMFLMNLQPLHPDAKC
jgi:chromosome segregation ATPase